MIHAIRAAVCLAVIPLVVGCGGNGPGGDSKGPDLADLPNVLLITLDTTRADHLGVYGYRYPTSPRMDRLADEGVVFDHAVAQASVTPVSHASIFSGQNPYRNGLRSLHGNIGYRMSGGVPTLAEVLSERGYATGGFISALPCGTRFGLDAGFDEFDDPFTTGEIRGGGISGQGIVNTGTGQRTAAATNARLFEWLDTAPSGPLFVWAHYFDPHDTRVLPEDKSDLEYIPIRGNRSRRTELLAFYDNEIRYMDRHVGEAVDRMRSMDRPLVIAIVGDHGEGLGDHGWWSHGILYQEQIRVPFMIVGPEVPAGKRVDSVVRTVDVAPTILTMLGFDASEAFGDIDGVDLGPLLRGESDDLGLMAYAEAITVGMNYRNPATMGVNEKKDELYVLIEGRWKYIHHRRSPAKSELYDLEEDPRELRNRLASEPEVVKRFRAQLDADDVLWDPSRATRGPALSAEDAKRLEDLGYIPEKNN